MKKILTIGILCVVLFSLNGCDIPSTNGGLKREGAKSITCTKSEMDDGYTTDETIVVNHSGNKLKNITNTVISYTNPTYIDMTLSYMEPVIEKLNNINGMSYTVSKNDETSIKYLVEIDFDKFDPTQITDEYDDYFEEDDILKYSSITTLESIKKELTDDDYFCE